jgi:hypothetical protein
MRTAVCFNDPLTPALSPKGEREKTGEETT